MHVRYYMYNLYSINIASFPPGLCWCHISELSSVCIALQALSWMLIYSGSLAISVIQRIIPTSTQPWQTKTSCSQSRVWITLTYWKITAQIAIRLTVTRKTTTLSALSLMMYHRPMWQRRKRAAYLGAWQRKPSMEPVHLRGTASGCARKIYFLSMMNC